MSEDSNVRLTLLSGPRRSAQLRPQQPLVPAERTLDLPALPIHLFGEPAVHQTAVGGGGPLPRAASLLGRDHTFAAQLLSDQDVRVFRVVAGVQQYVVQARAAACRPQDRRPFAQVVAGTPRHLGRQKQVRVAVAYRRQLRIVREHHAFAQTTGVIAGNVMRFQPGRVARDVTSVGHQALPAGQAKRAVQEAVKAPFFTRRFSA